MNDRRLNELIRMAGEVSALERSAEGTPTLRLAGSPAEVARVRVARRSWIGMLSAAAALAIAGLGTWYALAPSPSPVAPGPVAVNGSNSSGTTDSSSNAYVKNQPFGPALTVPGTEGAVVRTVQNTPIPGTPDESVVLAIYRDNTGGLRCVQLAAHTWANRCLPDVQPSELRDVRFGAPCVKEPQETLLIALAGPRRSLPTNEAGAVALAKCILSMPRGCDGEAACFSGPASQCVPAGVSVKIEAVADRSWSSDRIVP